MADGVHHAGCCGVLPFADRSLDIVHTDFLAVLPFHSQRDIVVYLDHGAGNRTRLSYYCAVLADLQFSCFFRRLWSHDLST